MERRLQNHHGRVPYIHLPVEVHDIGWMPGDIIQVDVNMKTGKVTMKRQDDQ